MFSNIHKRWVLVAHCKVHMSILIACTINDIPLVLCVVEVHLVLWFLTMHNSHVYGWSSIDVNGVLKVLTLTTVNPWYSSIITVFGFIVNSIWMSPPYSSMHVEYSQWSPHWCSTLLHNKAQDNGIFYQRHQYMHTKQQCVISCFDNYLPNLWFSQTVLA